MTREIDALNHRLESLHRNEGGLLAAPVSVGPKLATPVFDGVTDFNVFKIQFSTIAARNQWNDDDKAMVLLLSLRGVAATVLQTLPVSDRNDFATIMSALERRFGNEHSQHLLYLQLKSRVQQKGETIQEFAFEIERLVQNVFKDLPAKDLERQKTQAFVDGVKDAELRKQLMINPKEKFTEAVEYALLL